MITRVPARLPIASRSLRCISQRAVRPLDVRVLDHFIFAGADVTSFRALGLL